MNAFFLFAFFSATTRVKRISLLLFFLLTYMISTNFGRMYFTALMFIVFVVRGCLAALGIVQFTCSECAISR